MKRFIPLMALMVISLSASPALAGERKPPEPAQLELCGAQTIAAPWCGESLEVDTRQIQGMQIVSIVLAPSVQAEWIRLHRDRRGIGFTTVNAEGQTVPSGRGVISAVSRVVLIQDGDPEPWLFQAVVSPDASVMMLLLPSEGNFVGARAFVISSDGRHALSMNGEIIRLGGRHRTDGNLSIDWSRLSESRIPATTLIRRGDGTGAVELLEATFTDHSLVNDRDGTVRVYSGLAGTFTPITEGGTTTVEHTSCQTAGDRLVTRGNLRIDPATTVMTGGISLIPQAFQNLLVVLGSGCR
ncbi:MAG: hypothetical protein KIH67_004635 [Candidatus Moranbacteria bacterium]|nr:hypothetical protein [Candidatus Moranbacteria bacterium]